MERLSKDALLSASDLREEDVELPEIGGTVRVRGLPAAYSNEASSKALEMTQTAKGDSIATVNAGKLETLQVLHGLVEPKLSNEAEAEQFAKNCGPSFQKIVEAIARLSGVDKEALEQAQARFPSSGASANGSDVGDATPAGGS